MLTEEQGQVLVRLARQTIEIQLGVAPTSPVTDAELAQSGLQRKAGVFVTLHKRGELRGCIGSLAAVERVSDSVRRNAVNAAFQDYRFPPMRAEELGQVRVEVSVLTDPVPLAYTDADDLRRKLVPGRDGVILEGPGNAGATFLPQVWEQLPRVEDFLGHLCRKAGLPPNLWQTTPLTVFTYQVQAFSEPE